MKVSYCIRLFRHLYCVIIINHLVAAFVMSSFLYSIAAALILIFRFACDCKPGWEGVTCQINTNECLINPCAGNSQCLDEVNGYTCICSPGLIGEFYVVSVSTEFTACWLAL